MMFLSFGVAIYALLCIKQTIQSLMDVDKALTRIYEEVADFLAACENTKMGIFFNILSQAAIVAFFFYMCKSPVTQTLILTAGLFNASLMMALFSERLLPKKVFVPVEIYSTVAHTLVAVEQFYPLFGV